MPVRGVEPLSRAYESLVLTVELHWRFLRLVAGAGFAPAPQGYEPCEILLLHPAIICSILSGLLLHSADFFIIKHFRRKCNFSFLNFWDIFKISTRYKIFFDLKYL